MLKFIQTLFLMTACAYAVLSQSFQFEWEKKATVEVKNKTMLNPWTGGINSAQISMLDINNDLLEDIIIFDRDAHRVIPFIINKKDGKYNYIYDSFYESLFPLVNSWLLCIDYDQDGRKDLFTASGSDVRVFKNETKPNETIQFKLIKDPIRVKGFSGMINLSISSTDIPAFVDIEDDGDVDILTFNFSSGAYIEWYKNISQEKYANADSLEFERTGYCWGEFIKSHGCEEYEFGTNCQGGSSGGLGKKIEHTGSTLLAQDIDGDGDKDLIIGSVHCTQLIYLENKGTKQNPIFNAVGKLPIATTLQPAVFSGAFYEDIDHDGQKDLIISPNVPSDDVHTFDFSQSVWYYKHHMNEFELVQPDFLQHDMIDVGDNAYPALIDHDADGDLDLWIGNGEQPQADNLSYATIYLFENKGTTTHPYFQLITNDALHSSIWKSTYIKPQWIDIDGNNQKDIIVTSTQSGITSCKALLNTSLDEKSIIEDTQWVSIPLPLQNGDTPCFSDIDYDGDVDALVGKATGALWYYENKGTPTNPSFQLLTDSYLELKNNFFTKNKYPSISDINGDGLDELILGDRTGRIRIYSDFRTNTGVYQDSILYDSSKKRNSTLPSITELFPTCGDLNQDGLPELVIGTSMGGIWYLTNQTEKKQPDATKNCDLVCFPNPAADRFFIRTNCTGDLRIISIWGELITSFHVLAPLFSRSISTASLSPGVYIIQFSSSDSVLTQKVIVAQ